MNGYLCIFGDTYQFDGWTFGIHRYCGPWPLKKDGAPRERAGRKFWAMWARFNALSKTAKAKCRVARGGCFEIGQ